MSAETKENNLNGIFIVGIVNARSSRKYKNGDEHFFLHIACPGSETMHRVEVRAQDWGAFQEGTQFKSRVTYSTFNNNVTFEPSGN